MKKTLISGGIAAVVMMVASCTDHEVIPPPVPLVDLGCLCEGTIQTATGDTTFMYDDSCTFSSTKTISTVTLSNAEYQTQIRNASLTRGMEIQMGSIRWTDDGSNNPTSADWQAYFDNAVTNSPGFYPSANGAGDGIILKWTDPNGKIWTSDTTSGCTITNFTYNLFTYDKDTTGEYMEFDAVFNVRMLNSDYGVTDSARCLTNGHIKSAFRLD